MGRELWPTVRILVLLFGVLAIIYGHGIVQATGIGMVMAVGASFVDSVWCYVDMAANRWRSGWED